MKACESISEAEIKLGVNAVISGVSTTLAGTYKAYNYAHTGYEVGERVEKGAKALEALWGWIQAQKGSIDDIFIQTL